VEIGACRRVGLVGLFILLPPACLLCAQQPLESPAVPSQFTLDMETAARLRPQMMAASIPPTGRYDQGRVVFEKLVQQILPASASTRAWRLRIVDDDQWNAYSSPDGSVYVESGLAKLAGSSNGLWAAILSHELAHVIRRDWARRYLYEKSMQNAAGATITLGDPSVPWSSWMNPEKASAELGQFCRQMELEADREGLRLMVRAGYHPDFVPSLHHLLHARMDGLESSSAYSMHPCWEERDRELSEAYAEASREFEHRWPEWYASPGGNPPVLVFAEQPTLRKTGTKEWEISVPIRCQNLAGAVEVLLQEHSGRKSNPSIHSTRDLSQSGSEIRQVTGCTSPKTTVTFLLGSTEGQAKNNLKLTDIYVLDAWGSVLARADSLKLRR